MRVLFQQHPTAIAPAFFLIEFIHNSEKHLWELSEPPALPPGVAIPQEDIFFVRIALISHPLVVTADEELRAAINSQPVLGLKALSPTEAILLANDT